MDLNQHLNRSEEQWLSPSFKFLEAEFTRHPLPSHDHFHHLRVWKHARRLLTSLEKPEINIRYEFVESLLLSSMFHDSGMIIEKGSEHGKAGVEILNKFLDNMPQQPAGISAISEAIEKHDNKSYGLAGKLITDGEVMLLPALNISDDLDALGNIGVFRYSEIYLLRGISMEDLGLKIIANLSGRYGNFITNCARIPEMIKIHSIRHHTIESFFRLYNLQIRKINETGEEQTSGPVAVIKHIYKEIMKNTPTIRILSENILKSTDDPYVHNFFEALKLELHEEVPD